ncbi:DUF262 domain-containing protein [Desulfobulbus rhabdoformis]|uniref:DUF262 domain-containing protein n=1 Tax=Desulfobulbus rhabdoformis TaxID=34032 RepID=UPI001965A8EF|nr:DUF262 domain-containing protein [Desulfobulbus rhabdoformis]MBM9616662.1 DUF262 domain-containing protein [Desulfobulbus rhabdoformis]
MDNRVYYGEYSLKHWIELLLKKNIILPEYQRYFVWSEKKVETLIDTFRKNQFVPPITIGAFNSGGVNKNLILDGQQRITSVVLAYLGLYPDIQTYKRAIEEFANDNDDPDEESQFDNILEWNVGELTSKGKSKEEILSKIRDNNYKAISLNLDDDFLEKNFLGFSYLVPKTSNEKEQQKYYSSVFRNINIQGEPLLPQESRASLYFLDQDLVNLFSPGFSKKILIKIISNETKSDFVRYLALLSQYHNDGDEKKVARSYKQRMEKYYEEYLYAAISDEESVIFGKFSNVFPNKEYENSLGRLKKSLEELDVFGNYSSIVDVDMFLFGLTYHTLFRKKQIDVSKSEELRERLGRDINQFKSDRSHQKSPNNLGHLRNRISYSISIYGRYVINESQ